MKAICYSLFGYGKERHPQSYDFNSYLRGLLINIRMNKLIYPDWVIILQTDQSTYDGWKKLFDRLPIEVQINADAPLTKAMLWRLKPLFDCNDRQEKMYSHVLCRDLDSPPTYREAQAVQYWMNKNKAAHAITDSVSHNIPMLGGMIGFIPKYFTMLTGLVNWEQMFKNCDFDFQQKGMDQTFINRFLYPFFAKHGEDSITQHYVLGMPQSFLTDCHQVIQDMELSISYALRASNTVCGHIGAAGFYEPEMFRFLRPYWREFDALLEIEREYPSIFYWVNE